MHCLKVTSRHFIYYLSVLKEQKEVFQISFYVYCTLTEVKKEEKKKEERKKEKKKKRRRKKRFNLQYTLTSKKANIFTTNQLKSFPLINYILLISFHAY